jgi:hypothetical protein
MRHLLSLIAGVVAAPVAWALLAKGQDGAGDTIASWAAEHAFDTADLIVPGAYLAGTGILLGLIASLRLSPLGPLVAALGYLGLNAGLFIDPFTVRDAIPTKILGQSIPLRTPLFNGTLLVVGALLLVAVFSAKRWRRWPSAVAPEAATEPADTTAPREQPSPATSGDSGSDAALVGVETREAGTAGPPQPRPAADDTMASTSSSD